MKTEGILATKAGAFAERWNERYAELGAVKLLTPATTPMLPKTISVLEPVFNPL